jgi:hypothetical protein
VQLLLHLHLQQQCLLQLAPPRTLALAARAAAARRRRRRAAVALSGLPALTPIRAGWPRCWLLVLVVIVVVLTQHGIALAAGGAAAAAPLFVAVAVAGQLDVQPVLLQVALDMVDGEACNNEER